jgi:hypothetical protein
MSIFPRSTQNLTERLSILKQYSELPFGFTPHQPLTQKAAPLPCSEHSTKGKVLMIKISQKSVLILGVTQRNAVRKNIFEMNFRQSRKLFISCIIISCQGGLHRCCTQPKTPINCDEQMRHAKREVGSFCSGCFYKYISRYIYIITITCWRARGFLLQRERCHPR